MYLLPINNLKIHNTFKNDYFSNLKIYLNREIYKSALISLVSIQMFKITTQFAITFLHFFRLSLVCTTPNIVLIYCSRTAAVVSDFLPTCLAAKLSRSFSSAIIKQGCIIKLWLRTFLHENSFHLELEGFFCKPLKL